MKKPELFNETHTATYCPEDNKLRLYVGRVPRNEYEALRAEGWTSTPKQGCDFVAAWNPTREETALSYAGEIEDEDQDPGERAAERAERFAGYLGKRVAEAGSFADKYESGPAAFGFQSQDKAERAAARHDRIADKAVTQWEKAEYWQRRTYGVIQNAIYKDLPGVRMGRIKILEADLRKAEKRIADWKLEFSLWEEVAALPQGEEKTKKTVLLSGGLNSHGFRHPRPDSEGLTAYFRENTTSLYSLLTCAAPISAAEACELFFARYKKPEGESRGMQHLRLRLAYENQMLEAQGGRAASVDMVPGGWIGKRQIQKVNKSPATGRVVSVTVWGTTTGFTKESGYTKQDTWPVLVAIKTERLPKDAYRAPTEEELAAFNAEKKAIKKENPISFINPTLEDAKRLQAILNERAAETDKGKNYPRQMSEVSEITQARYSHGPSDYRTTKIVNGVKFRIYLTGWNSVDSVVVLTDKPQKPFPASFWNVEVTA